MSGRFAAALRMMHLGGPAAPPSGSSSLFFKGDAKLYTKASSGVEEKVAVITDLDSKANVSHGHAIADLPVASSGISSATQVVRADDSRLSGSRTPSGAAGGALSGAYPSPTIANEAVTAAKIAPSTITTKQLVVSDSENAVTDFSQAANRTAYPATGLLSWDYSGGEPLGAWRLKITGSGPSNYTIFSVGPPIPVVPGQEFLFEYGIYLQGNPNYDVALNFLVQDQRGTVVNYDTGVPTSRSSTQNNWLTKTVVVTIPANGALVYPEVKINPTVAEATRQGDYFFRNMSIRRRSGSSLIADGAITPEKIASAAITEGKVAEGAITAKKLNIAIGGGNLVTDSSFEQSTGTGPWTWINNGPGSMALSTEVAWQGTKSMKVVAGQENWGYLNPFSALRAGRTYTFSIYVYSLTAQDLVLTNYNTPVQGPVVSALANTWHRLRLTQTIPTNATGVFLSVRHPGRVAQIGTVYLDGFQVEEGDVPTAYSPKTDEILPGTVTDTEISSANKDGLATRPSMRTLGTGAQQAVAGNDARLANARTPTAHTHAIADLPVAASGTSSATQVVRADDARLSNARTPTTHNHDIVDVTGVTAFARTVLDDTSASSARTTLDVYSKGEADALAVPTGLMGSAKLTATTTMPSNTTLGGSAGYVPGLSVTVTGEGRPVVLSLFLPSVKRNSTTSTYCYLYVNQGSDMVGLSIVKGLGTADPGDTGHFAMSTGVLTQGVNYTFSAGSSSPTTGTRTALCGATYPAELRVTRA